MLPVNILFAVATALRVPQVLAAYGGMLSIGVLQIPEGSQCPCKKTMSMQEDMSWKVVGSLPGDGKRFF